MRTLGHLGFLSLLVSLCTVGSYAQTSASFLTCDGLWSNGANWSSGVAPNNNSTTTYNVIINLPQPQCHSASFALVDLNQDVVINSLSLGFDNFLVARTSTPQTFTILSDFNNMGGVEFFNGSTLRVDGAFINNNVQGTAEDSVDFANGGSLISRGLTNNGSLFVGPGSLIDARGGAFTNLDSSTGTLNGGAIPGLNVVFSIDGTFRFDPGQGAFGGNIINIGPHVILVLDGGQILYGPGPGIDALARLVSNAGFLGFNGNLSLGNFNNSGSLSGQLGSMTVNGNLKNSGTFDVGTVLVAGTVNNSGQLTLSTLTVTNGHNYLQAPPGTTIVNGSLTAGKIDIQGALLLAGTVNGDLTIEPNGHETGQGIVNGNLRINGGTFVGPGTSVNGDLLNTGTLEDGSKSGILTIGGDFTQTNQGSLSEALRGPASFDQIDTSGTADLGGTLDIMTDFSPYGGETFTILDAASLSGQFSNIVGDRFDKGLDYWSVIYTPTSVQLVANTPEPSTLILLGIGFLGLLGYLKWTRASAVRQTRM